MNDHQEMSWGLLEGRRQLLAHKGLAEACESTEHYQELVHAFSYYFDAFLDQHVNDVYVGCFCKHEAEDHDGLLSMWRAYGANGGGVAIEFETSKLQPHDEATLVLHPVTYASTADRIAWITNKLDEAAAMIAKERPAKDQLMYAAWHLLQRLKMFALFTKHKGFSEEKEWRIVYFSDRDGAKRYNSMLSYLVNEKGIQPKLKLKIGSAISAISPVALTDLISSIILGPTAGAPLSQMAVRRMLVQQGKPELADRVRVSTTPFRSL